VRKLDRMVKGQQVAQRTEPNPSGPEKRLRNQQIRGRTGLPGSGKVLADPSLLESERVQPFKVAEVTFMAIPDTPLRGMGRHEQGT